MDGASRPDHRSSCEYEIHIVKAEWVDKNVFSVEYFYFKPGGHPNLHTD